MKRFILNMAAVLCLVLGIVIEASATQAIRQPVVVRQPDGTTVTVKIHGDEFLNWMTVGNRVVAYGNDGYLHYASIMTDGKKQLGERLSASGAAFSSGKAPLPPKPAIEMAKRRRAELAGMMATKRGTKSNKNFSVGGHKFLVLLVQFPDRKFVSPTAYQDFSDMLNKRGFNQYGGTGSAKEYYEDCSNNLFLPDFVVAPIVTASQPASYYAQNDGTDAYPKPGVGSLIVETCDSLKKKGFNFSEFDVNNDGYIDNVFLYFAGHNTAEGASSAIWPHAWSIVGGVTYDGKILSNYSCASELRGSSGTTVAGIGTFCHEFGHVLGLPDLYDIDYDKDGQGSGLGDYSLMSGGNYNNQGRTPPYLNIVEKLMLGWGTAERDCPTLEESGEYTLAAIGKGGKAYNTPTQTDGEVFVYEYRDGTGWDAPVSHGLIIYHIDRSTNLVSGMRAIDRWNSSINAIGMHQCFYIINDKPFASGTFDDKSTPQAKDWNGNLTGYNITISPVSKGAERVSFTLNITRSTTVSGIAKDNNGIPVADATVVISEYEQAASGSAKSFGDAKRFSMAPAKVVKAECKTAKDGSFALDISDIKSDVIEISVEKRGYISYNEVKEFKYGSLEINAVLHLPGGDKTESKSQMNTQTGVGYGSASVDLYVAQKFLPGELSKYDGYQLKSINYKLYGVSFASVLKVFVYENDVKVFEKDNLSGTQFSTLTKADVSDKGVIIDANKTYLIGYQINTSSSEYPIAVSESKTASNALLLSPNSSSWTDFTSYSGWKGLSYAADISISLTKSSTIFYDTKIAIIGDGKTTYKPGDRFEYSINIPAKDYSSIEWFLDGNAKGASPAAETLTAGEHTIKAVITYNNGLKENLITEVKVQ